MRCHAVWFAVTLALPQDTPQDRPDPAKCPPSRVALAPGLSFADNLTVRAPKDFLREHATRTPDGALQTVVEVPAGTLEKWEVKTDGAMRWDIKDGKPRHVQYLGYPCNYGMVPRTCLGKELGGDGDPLDVLVLGTTLPRGLLVPVQVVAVIRLTDSGDKDDKLIGVAADSPFAKVTSLADLDAQFPGVTAILRTWFENYKGRDKVQCTGFGERAEAEALLATATASFERAEAESKKDAGARK